MRALEEVVSYPSGARLFLPVVRSPPAPKKARNGNYGDSALIGHSAAASSCAVAGSTYGVGLILLGYMVDYQMCGPGGCGRVRFRGPSRAAFDRAQGRD